MALGSWKDVTAQLKGFKAEFVHDENARRVALPDQESGMPPLVDRKVPSEEEDDTPSQALFYVI